MYGAEMWILALAKNLKKLGLDCHLAVTRESESQTRELFLRYQNLGLPAYAIKMKGRFDPSVVYKLTRLIKEKKISIIHTHGYKSDIIGLAAARIAGIKALATPHGFENSKNFKLQLFIRAGCFSLRFFDAIAPLSDELFSDMEKIKIQNDKIKLIQNGVDLDEINDALEKPLLNEVKPDCSMMKIGYVGQLAFRKNIRDLILCFDLLYKSIKNIQLVLIGDGPLKNELEQMARTLPSSEQIHFLGYRKDRLEILKELDVFCMTSSLEGIPRCMMEAMAMGKAVAAYDIPGVDKLIINEKTGLSTDFGNIRGLKNCLERLIVDKDFSKQMAVNGKEHVINYFSASRMAGEYMDLYKKLLI